MLERKGVGHRTSMVTRVLILIFAVIITAIVTVYVSRCADSDEGEYNPVTVEFDLGVTEPIEAGSIVVATLSACNLVDESLSYAFSTTWTPIGNDDRVSRPSFTRVGELPANICLTGLPFEVTIPDTLESGEWQFIGIVQIENQDGRKANTGFQSDVITVLPPVGE